MSESSPPEPPPLGEPIPIEFPDGDDQGNSGGAGSGENVVIIPQTAGSAGAALPEEG